MKLYKLIMVENGDITIFKNCNEGGIIAIYHKSYNMGDDLKQNLINAYEWAEEWAEEWEENEKL